MAAAIMFRAMLFIIFFIALVPMLEEGRVQPVRGSVEEAAVVPLKRDEGRWLTLKEARALTRNITALTDQELAELQEGKDPEPILSNAYAKKHSLLPLYAETLYRSLPWFLLLTFLYAAAVFYPRLTLFALLFHTLLLLVRVVILARPPVSNMAETLLYVPWIAALLGLLLKERRAGALAAFLLLALLQFTFNSVHLETVQPVLNSSFWLTTHVLMVVGSYGAFFIASLLAHSALIRNREPSKALIATLYTGTIALISGTLLGGVWAAESWGRFWDWDPKESWAFVSSAVYLLLIHAYRFGKIGSRGLAFGAILGFLFISFTWYGVNYLLGVGLHSYGFGTGGVGYYILFIAVELLFVTERLRNALFRID